MKKVFTLLIMTFLIFGMFGIVSAEEETSELKIPEAGSIGPFERVMENFRLGLISNPEKKAEKAMILAEERLAEIEKLTEEGNLEKAEGLREHYEKMIQKSERALEKVQSKDDLKKSENALRRMARIENYAERHDERLNEIRARIMENNPNMTEEELEKVNEMFEKFSEKSADLEAKALERLENFEIKHKVLSEMTDEELLALKEKIESEEGIAEQKQKRLEREKTRNVREFQAREINLERIKTRIENSNMTEEEKTQALERVQMQEQKFEEFKAKKEQMFQLQEQRKEEAKERFEANAEARELHKEVVAQKIDAELESRGNSTA